MRDLRFDGTELLTLVFLLLVAVLFFIAVSCAPRTDLYGESNPRATDPSGGSAAGALVDPSAGAIDLPRNLAAIVVRLAVAVQIDTAVFRLRPAQGGAAAALGSPSAVPCAPGASAAADHCYRVPVAALLEPSRAYLFELLSATVAPDGTAAPAGVIGGFDSGDASDAAAPRVLDFAVTLAGPCAGVRFSTDEPVVAAVIVRAGAAEAITPAGLGLAAFDLAVAFQGLDPAAPAEIVLQLVDRAGNEAVSSAGTVEVPPATPPLAITEVLANPAGTEPAQEFVELRNLGDSDLSLAGLRLEDARGADVLPEATLAPGGYALLVPSSFDPQSTRDVAPRPGTLMVPIDARLGADGLSNAGEVVRLRLPGTAMEPIVSSYGGWVDVSAASAAGKSVHRLVDGACDHPTAWTRPPRAATPGWGTP
ncbi:MAG TPA: lamin tail domain-containing protein [Polyangia bacterium]|jgi:hypothetical protein|nr:lamin tail domain-containing protein [Polyangia bacterium]